MMKHMMFDGRLVRIIWYEGKFVVVRDRYNEMLVRQYELSSSK